MKITLGTVQFGLNYGISNKNGIPLDAELRSIFETAKKFGIKYLDTAKAYGNAEERIGELSNNEFQIISKFPNVSSVGELRTVFLETLYNLKAKSIYGYLAHNADVLINNPELWNVLLELKKEGKINKIGYSLYQPEQLDKLIKLNLIPDLVQLPYSILDRKFETKFELLRSLGTEIHVRSVFLQGLYFMNPDELPKKLKALQPILNEFQNYCQEEKVSASEVALNFAILNKNIDQVVLGVENAEQLQENINLVLSWKSNSSLFSKIETIEIKDKSLLNPVNW